MGDIYQSKCAVPEEQVGFMAKFGLDSFCMRDAKESLKKSGSFFTGPESTSG